MDDPSNMSMGMNATDPPAPAPNPGMPDPAVIKAMVLALMWGQARDVYINGLAVILPIGFLLNCVALVTMLRKRLRAFSAATYLACAAVTDNVVLLASGATMLVFYQTGMDVSRYTDCVLAPFFQNISCQSTAWLLVVVTADRSALKSDLFCFFS